MLRLMTRMMVFNILVRFFSVCFMIHVKVVICDSLIRFVFLTLSSMLMSIILWSSLLMSYYANLSLLLNCPNFFGMILIHISVIQEQINNHHNIMSFCEILHRLFTLNISNKYFVSIFIILHTELHMVINHLIFNIQVLIIEYLF